MKYRKVAIAFVAATTLGLTGCVDSDGDGLTNGEEADLGTDPDVADSDGDGIDDGAEVEMGINPLAADTDGDGYSDFDEIEEGSDPADEDDGIFEGGFPFNPDVEDCDDEDFSGSASEGDQLPCATFVNQWDEDYNLWNMRGSAEFLVIDTSAVWCGPCNSMAAWLAGDSPTLFGSTLDNARENVWEGKARWITGLYEDGSGQPADVGDAEAWEDDYPAEGVPVIVDDDSDLVSWIGPPGIPSLSLVDLETMELVIVDDTNGVLNELENL
ncbi:MAG: hypothetical protein KDA24_05545 [Deltaproteobacteria bacterium]|nr:hypothetical protein [Deltaproteobacteria bacterium]